MTAMWYPHYMMTFEIFENTGTNGRTLVIPHSQLELLCTVLNHLGQVARETTQSPPHEVPEPEDSSPYQHSMTVTMHKPLGSEYAANNYAFLTDPLPRHFRDHHNSSQVSHQPDGLDQKVSQAISSPRFKTVEEAFTALQQLKEAGASAWKDKDYQQAANLWTNALYEARFWFREPSLGSWIKTKAAENADRFNEWQYRAGLNAAAAWLALAKTKPAERQYYASMSEWVLHRIPQLQPPIGWEPDTAMLAKFDYRSAVAERMLGNLPPAREAIHSAIAEAPNDPAVRAEFELIESESRIASGTAGTDIIEIPMGSFRWPG